MLHTRATLSCSPTPPKAFALGFVPSFGVVPLRFRHRFATEPFGKNPPNGLRLAGGYCVSVGNRRALCTVVKLQSDSPASYITLIMCFALRAAVRLAPT